MDQYEKGLGKTLSLDAIFKNLKEISETSRYMHLL